MIHTVGLGVYQYRCTCGNTETEKQIAIVLHISHWRSRIRNSTTHKWLKPHIVAHKIFTCYNTWVGEIGL